MTPFSSITTRIATGACALLLVLAAFWALSPTPSTADQTTKSFRIVIEKTESGFEMVCEEGCAWETLSYSCDGQSDCKALLNKSGIARLNSK